MKKGGTAVTASISPSSSSSSSSAASSPAKAKHHLQILKKELRWPSIKDKGSLVEVTSDEEGFKGAWYVATLLHLPSSSDSPPLSSISPSIFKRKRKRKLQAYVEYHSLVADEASSEPLREYVDVQFVRPLPPREDFPEPFQLGDLVDAYSRDGWWTGVITGIVHHGLRFVVTFQNPPEDIDFGLSELRFHRQWVNRKWVRPAKQRATGLMFSVGKRVEVSFDSEDRRDAWFPATILEDAGNGCYLVEYESPVKGSDSDEKCRVKTTVDCLHLRPCPPHLKDHVFQLLEKVDVSFDSGWRSGVITKQLADCRYLVYFKCTNKDGEFSRTQLRPHMEWKNGNWFTSYQEVVLKPSDYHIHEDHNTEVTVPLNGPGFKEDGEKKNFSLNLNEVYLSHCNEESPIGATSLKDTRQDFPSVSVDKDISKEKTSKGMLSPTLNAKRSNSSAPVEKMKIYEYASSSPEAVGNNLTNQSLDADPSDSYTWGKRVKRKRIKISEGDAPGSGRTSGSLKKLLGEDPSNSIGVGNDKEGVPEDHVAVQNKLPVVLGLECDKGSNSTARKPYHHSSGEELLRHVAVRCVPNDNQPPSVKDGDQLESQENTAKRGRGRPRSVKKSSPSETTKVVNDFLASDDSLKDVEIRSGIIDFSLPSQEIVVNPIGKKIIIEQEKHEKKSNTVSLSQLRQQERRTTKRGRRRTVNVNAVSQGQDGSRASTGKTDESNSTAEEGEIGNEESTAKTFEDQPLSKWFQEMHSPAIIGASKVSVVKVDEQSVVVSNKQQQEIIVEESVGVDKEHQEVVGSEVENLPFVKNTLLWSTLEAMEVFRKLPQRPHFRPLEEHKESCREGLAIGFMVNFCSVVERSSKLQFDDPKSTIDDLLDTLTELEGHGFSVEVVRDHVRNLQMMKEKEGKLREEFEQLNDEIEKLNHDRVGIDAEMVEINKQIAMLQEKLTQATAVKESKDREIESLQTKLEGMKEGMRSMECDFQQSAASLG